MKVYRLRIAHSSSEYAQTRPTYDLVERNAVHQIVT